MQTIIRSAFQHATVITIAHRISTIADSDLILVMDQGHVVGFGTPQELLSDPQSMYSVLYHAELEVAAPSVA